MAAEKHVENADQPPEKRRKVENSVLDNFTELTKSQDKTRIIGGLNLIRHLASTSKTENENETKYALGRLIRGLGASQINTRIGYYSTLVALLNINEITCEEVLEHVQKELHKSGSNSKSEMADVSTGRILVAAAVLRSKLYQNLTNEEKNQILDILINAGKERDYLTLASYLSIVDLYRKIDQKEFETVIFPKIKPEVAKSWKEQDLDSLYLMLETQKAFQDGLNPKFLKNALGTCDIICKKSLQDLCNILTSLPRATTLRHPIFASITEFILKSNLVVEFFENLDETLVRPTRNRYFAIITLLNSVIERIPDANVIPDLLRSRFIQQTVVNLKLKVGKLRDEEFQQLVGKLFENLLNRLKGDEVKSKTKLKVLKKLLFHPGTFIFEKITKTKLIQNITHILNDDGVKKLAEIYKGVILAVEDRVVGDKSEKWWNSDRIYAAHLLIKLINHQQMNDNDWKIDQIDFLMRLGLLRHHDECSDEFGQELAVSFRDVFYASLDLKLSKLEDLRAILSKILKNLDEILTTQPDSFRVELQPDHLEIWTRTVQICAKLEKKKKNQVFHTLFLHLGLQLFNDNPKLASDSLEELFSCYERLKKAKKHEEIDSSSNEPLWIEVVVDLFLNLLSHPSHLLRKVISCVFPHLCQYMTATSIHQILTVLDPKNADNPLTQQNESDLSSDDDDDDDDEEDESQSDYDDTVGNKLKMALHQVLHTDTAISDVDSVDLDDLDEESGEKLDEALGQVFKTFKPNVGRKKNKQNKDEQVLTHFRIRVLDLIDIYLTSNPTLYLTLEIMLPLLQILEFSIRDSHQKPLEVRIKSSLKKLTSLRKFDNVDDVTDKVIETLLKSLLEKGTKNAIILQDLSEKIADCCSFLINASQIVPSSSRKKRIAMVIRNSLVTFFEQRDSLIPYVLFKNVLQMNWIGAIELVSILFGVVYNDNVRPFRRNQSLDLLRIFYQNHRLLTAKKDDVDCDIREKQIDFLLKSIDFFKDLSLNIQERKIRERFLGNLFLVLAAIKNSPIGEFFNQWDQVSLNVREIRSHLTFSKDTKVAFAKLCRSLNVSHVVAMKPSAVKLSILDDDGATSVKVGKIPKKTVKRRGTLKDRKECKELRLSSLSEGLNRAKVTDFPLDD